MHIFIAGKYNLLGLKYNCKNLFYYKKELKLLHQNDFYNLSGNSW